jgi:hypothetical protein
MQRVHLIPNGTGIDGFVHHDPGISGYVLSLVPAPAFMPGDLNGDDMVNFGDLTPFVLALTDTAAYDAMFPELVDTRVGRCDTSGDSACNFGDLTPFVNLLTGEPGSSSAIPEPSMVLLAVAAGVLLVPKRLRC